MSTTHALPRRRNDAVIAIAMSLLAAAALGVFAGSLGALLVVPLVGALAGALARDRNAAAAGLLGGFLIICGAWGAMTVGGQIATCEPDCGGLSSPAITLILVVAIGVAVELAAAVGFVTGRVARRLWTAHAT